MSKNPTLVALGTRIRKLRLAKGYNQEDFAYKANLDRAYFGGVERGERNISALNLIRIAIALEVEVGEIFPPLKELARETDSKDIHL